LKGSGDQERLPFALNEAIGHHPLRPPRPVPAASQLRALGVDVRIGVNVVAADAECYVLDGGERIPAALKVWAPLGDCRMQIVVTSEAQMAANSAGQIFATVATLAVIPKISSRRPKLAQYRSGQAWSAVIE
jgi:hypothetical protein